jgi:hypothetical protein
MATYAQWARSRQVRRVMWVCGPEPALRSEVTAAARQGAGEVSVFFAGADSEAAVWAAAGQLSEEPRTVVVHDAQRLRRWDQLTAILAAPELAAARLVLVSPDDDFPHAGGVLAAHAAEIRDSRAGSLIRCVAPRGDDLAAWVAAAVPGTGKVAAHALVTRAGGDITALKWACEKLQRARLELTASWAAALAPEHPAEDFADSLVLGSRRAALLAAGLTRGGDAGAAIGLLDSRLDTLARLREAAARKLAPRDISIKYGIGHYLLRRYAGVAGAYGPARVRRCRSLLAFADDAWRAGAPEQAVLECVAAAW